jgi:hypothetical protein
MVALAGALVWTGVVGQAGHEGVMKVDTDIPLQEAGQQPMPA